MSVRKRVAHVQAGSRTAALRSTLVLCDAAVLLLCLRRSVLFVYVYVLVHQSVCLEL